MIFSYLSERSDADDYTIFMGFHKNENEDLTKCGFSEDIW
jgi:hypothetical protein